MTSTRSSLFFLKFSFLKKKKKKGTKTFAAMRQTFSSGDNIQACSFTKFKLKGKKKKS